MMPESYCPVHNVDAREFPTRDLRTFLWCTSTDEGACEYCRAAATAVLDQRDGDR